MTVRAVEVRKPPVVPACWERGRNGLAAVPEPRFPEPARLYQLTVLYLVLHAPYPEAAGLAGHCVACGRIWPCDSARLAYRLREGF